jgi:hypothetical protein
VKIIQNALKKQDTKFKKLQLNSSGQVSKENTNKFVGASYADSTQLEFKLEVLEKKQDDRL